METFKTIKGFEGLYQVSNLGRVKSLKRRGNWKERILKPGLSTHKYHQVMLWKEGKQYGRRVHCLVMEAFVGERPEKYDINHKNGIKTDNRLENLEWSTHKENSIHSFHILKNNHHLKNKPTNPNKGKTMEKSHLIKAVKQYTMDGKFINKWECIKRASIQTGINASNISSCCSGHKCYSHAGGFKWEYA